MPNSGQPNSSFNVDAILSLGRLEEGMGSLQRMHLEQQTSIKDIQIRLNDLSAITQLQERHNNDILDAKRDRERLWESVNRLKEQRAWLMGASTFFGALASYLFELARGHVGVH